MAILSVLLFSCLAGHSLCHRHDHLAGDSAAIISSEGSAKTSKNDHQHHLDWDSKTDVADPVDVIAAGSADKGQCRRWQGWHYEGEKSKACASFPIENQYYCYFCATSADSDPYTPVEIFIEEETLAEAARKGMIEKEVQLKTGETEAKACDKCQQQCGKSKPCIDLMHEDGGIAEPGKNVVRVEGLYDNGEQPTLSRSSARSFRDDDNGEQPSLSRSNARSLKDAEAANSLAQQRQQFTKADAELKRQQDVSKYRSMCGGRPS